MMANIETYFFTSTSKTVDNVLLYNIIYIICQKKIDLIGIKKNY